MILQKRGIRFTSLILAAVGLFLLAFLRSEAQFRLDNWKTYTSLWDTKAMSYDWSGRIWVGTTGGIYSFDPLKPDSSSITEYRNIDALMSMNITALSCNFADSTIYAGTSEGILEILTKDGTWTHILDIKNANFPNPTINDIIFRGDIAYIAGQFGITTFDIKNKVFVEDAFNFGDFQPHTNTNKILIFRDTLWAATDAGLAGASIKSSLSPRNAWKTFTTKDGLPANKVIDLAIYKDQLYVANPERISAFDGDTFRIKVYDYIKNISAIGDSLYYSTARGVFLEGKELAINKPSDITGHVTISGKEGNILIVSFSELGIGIYKDSTLKRVLPNTSAFNYFRSMDVDKNGRLLACPDGGSEAIGFSILEAGDWKNYIKYNYSKPLFDSFRKIYKVYFHPDGRLFLSTWLAGEIIAQPVDTGYAFKVLDSSNSPFSGDDIVTGQTIFDFTGTAWMVQYGYSGPTPIVVALDKEGRFYPFYNRVSSSDRHYLYITIDDFGTKWIGSDNGGLYYFNDRNTLDNTADDIFGKITTSTPGSTIIDNNITSLVKDKSGIIWVGTETGLSMILTPSSVLSGTNPIIRTSCPYLKDQWVNEIMVDALNYKWIATKNGVYVLNADCTEPIAIITTQNSPLVDNNVISLATDPSNGKVYLGTKFGLSEVSTLSIKPSENFTLKCYPQPFMPVRDNEMVIDGLAADADVRIVTSNGELIKTISSYGKTAVWDGKTNDGRQAASGIYLILATSLSTNEVSVAKIALIRQ